MSWLWANPALGVIFLGCWAGIPLWIVVRNPTWGPMSAHCHGTQAAAPVLVPEGVVLDEDFGGDEISLFDSADAVVR